MKKPILLAAAVAALALTPAFAQSPAPAAAASAAVPAAFDIDELHAIDSTVPEVVESLRKLERDPALTFAVFPIAGDRAGAVAGSVKAAVTQAGKRCIEGRADPAWKTLVDEFFSDAHNAALLKEEFLTAIGRLTTVDYLVYGKVRNVTATPKSVAVEYELHAADVKTHEHVWGGVFSKTLARGAAAEKPLLPEEAVFSAAERRTFRALMDDLVPALQAAPIPSGATVGVMPLVNDRGRTVVDLVKGAATDAGRTCASHGDDPMWVEILREMAFDEKKAQFLDQKTIEKIGSVLGSEVLLHGVVRSQPAAGGGATAELDLHATDVKTGRHLWSRTFEKTWTPAAPRAPFSPAERKAIALAMSDVVADLRISAIGPKMSVSVLPLDDDAQDVACLALKRAVTDAGKTYVEGKEDPMWGEILSEMVFDGRWDGVLDPATLVKIGSLKATDVLVYGTVRTRAAAGGGATVELDLHGTDVKTKRHIWGKLFERTFVPEAARAPFTDDQREAIAHAIEEVVASLKASKELEDKAISILPIVNDSEEVVYSYLKNAVVAAGRRCVEHKDDPMWNEVVAEMVFDDRNNGLLDEATLVRFGSLKATDVLLYGTLRSCTQTGNRIQVELDLHATDVATKRVLWNTDVQKRWYTTGTDVAEKGLSDIPQPLRARLAESIRAKLVDSLKAESKLKGVQSIVLTPLTGDQDLYCSHILRDAITKSGFLVGNDMDRSTFQGAKPTDSVAYGEVRRLDFVEEIGFLDLFRDYGLDVDLQSAISQNEGRSVLWSDTVQDVVVWREWNWARVVLLAVGILFVLWIVHAFFKAVTRVR